MSESGFDTEYTNELANLIAKRFIQRKDVKAIQHGSKGAYRPVESRWTKGDLRDHLNKNHTYGHYLLDQDSLVKLFAFDVDLTDSGFWVERPDLSDIPDDSTADEVYLASRVIHETNPREDWLNRKHPGRSFYKLQLRMIAEMLSSAIHRFAGLDTACAYSGNKGVHVYGFLPEPTSAEVARQIAQRVLGYAGTAYDREGKFITTSGTFYKYNIEDPEVGLKNFSVELFPKQDSVKSGHYGNLMRLPLGKNLKNPKDPTFFLDQSTAFSEFAPHPDPVSLLKSGNPWVDTESNR